MELSNFKEGGYPYSLSQPSGEAPLLSRHPLGSPVFLFQFYFLSLLYIFPPRYEWNLMKNEDFLQVALQTYLRDLLHFDVCAGEM